MPRTHVIGAGLAGLATAVSLVVVPCLYLILADALGGLAWLRSAVFGPTDAARL